MRNICSVLFGVLLGSVLLHNCGKNPVSVDGDWVSDIPFMLGDINLEIQHDNRIYETEHFLVYSDAASDKVRLQFAAHAERALDELMDAFQIPDAAAIGIVDQTSKLMIFTNTALTRGQSAFPTGFILYGEDSEVFANWPHEMRSRFYHEIKHETMHVLQYKMGVGVPPNSRNPANLPDKWFNEGLAEYLGGGFMEPITNRVEFEQWRRPSDHINPVSIHKWSDLPINMSIAGEYYPAFALAVRYLLDADSMGKTLMDVKDMFALLAEGNTTFADAFDLHMGISIGEYEATFISRVAEYLD